MIAWKGDLCLLIECKSPTGDRRDSQVEFWLEFREACLGSRHNIYIVARSLLDVTDELSKL